MTAKMFMRLAMRHEGSFWNAYLAPSDNMKDARLLGSLTMALARDPACKEAFMELMKAGITLIAKEAIKVDVEWPNPPQPAPERERSGHG